MSDVTVRDLLKPFAESIVAKISALKRFDEAKCLTKSQRARLMEAISHDIRKCTNFVPSRVSKAAFEEASNLGVDLRQMDWHDQTRFNPGRCKFHREHMVLVKTIRDECCGAITDDEVLETLLTKPRVVWILKSEDAELTRLGYRSKRDDSLAAYQNAGIELLE